MSDKTCKRNTCKDLVLSRHKQKKRPVEWASFLSEKNRESESTLNDALCGADCNASGSISKTGALVAGCGIDNVDLAACGDSVGRAFGFASTAVGAFFGDIQCHIDDVL
jgi:hypothetical protein